MNEAFVDHDYVQFVQKAGEPPSNITELATKTSHVDLFVTFAENQQEANDLKPYVTVINELLVENVSVGDVWKKVQDVWDKEEYSLNELLEDDDLKKQLLKESFEKLEPTYSKMFVPLAEKILKGGFDDKENEQGEIEKEPEDQLELLMKQLAVEVKAKNIEVESFVKSLKIDSFETNDVELENQLKLLSNADLSNKESIKNLRRESTVDEKDFNLLLTELNEINELDAEEQSVEKMLADLLDFQQDLGQKEIVDYIDSLDDVPLDQNKLEELLKWADEYSNASGEQGKNLKVKEIVNNSPVEKDQFELLLNEVEKMCEVDVDYVKVLDELLNELAEEAPGNQVSMNFLNSVIPENLKIKSDRDSLFDNLLKLNQADERESKLIRKRVSTLIDKDELDQLFKDLTSNEIEEGNAGGDAQAPPKPKLEALKPTEYDVGLVSDTNYAALNNAPAGAMVAVLAGGGVALLGSAWATDTNLAKYVNGFSKAFDKEIEYPASGNVERGQAVVEKGSGLFNPGSVTISGISDNENKDAIRTAIAARSKKKVKFV